MRGGLPVAMALVLAGCGGGGGGGGGGTVATSTTADSGGTTQEETTQFETLSSLSAPTELLTTSSTVDFSGASLSGDATPATSDTVITAFPDQSVNLSVPSRNIDVTFGQADAAGTIEAGGLSFTSYQQDGSRFADVAALDYTEFGAWQVFDAATSGSSGVFAAGMPTAQDAMPTTGSATYTGATIGGLADASENRLYNLLGAVSMAADFAAGSITGQMTRMTAHPVGGGTAQAWNDVGFTAGISGATFSGSTSAVDSGSSLAISSDASGQLAGAFFGPNAEEAGASWSLNGSNQQAFGAFGVSR